MRVAVLEYNETSRIYEIQIILDLASVPSKNDKVVFDIEGQGIVFNVDEVIYSGGKKVDLNVTRVSDITDFNTRRKK